MWLRREKRAELANFINYINFLCKIIKTLLILKLIKRRNKVEYCKAKDLKDFQGVTAYLSKFPSFFQVLLVLPNFVGISKCSNICWECRKHAS